MSWFMVRALAAVGRNYIDVPGVWRLRRRMLGWVRRNGRRLGWRRAYLGAYGFRYWCDLGYWFDQAIFATGDYEPPTPRVMLGLVRPGDVFLDIGANAGFYSLLMAAAGCQVHAIEPAPRCRELLARNLALNPLLSVTVHPWAASNEAGDAVINVGPTGLSGLSSLRDISEPPEGVTNYDVSEIEAVTVETRRVDDQPWSKVALVKIDIEGAEMKALEGMAGVIERDRPAIVFELTDGFLRQLGSSAAELTGWLTVRGYGLHRIHYRGVEPLTEADLRDPQFNVLALPN